MKNITKLAAALAIAAQAALASPVIEVGASYFDFRDGDFEGAPGALVAVDASNKLAPFIATTLPFGESFGLRFAYHYVHDVTTTVQFGAPPGLPASPLSVSVWGIYRDDIHLASVAPEFSWRLHPQARLTLAPQLNWIASRGLVSHTSNSALILLRAPYRRNDDGFTWGGAARLKWSLGPRSTVSVGYQYLDLDPSFGRKAHVYSAGWSWQF